MHSTDRSNKAIITCAITGVLPGSSVCEVCHGPKTHRHPIRSG